MKRFCKIPYWSPYLVGILLGLVIMLEWYFAGQGIGVSSAFAGLRCMATYVGMPFYKGMTSLYCTLEFSPRPLINHKIMLIVGIILGAFISSKLSGSYRIVHVPDLWVQRFGRSYTKRAVGAFFGGVLIMVGVPLAVGCTLSRGIFSAALLEVSGWLFLSSALLTAIVTAFFLYGVTFEG